jgi:ATP/maltotriose-dependent transcriptional regulator MalT
MWLMEQENMFIVRLDDDREWFRYHHLFAELLRHRLDQWHPRLRSELCLRAVTWYEAHALWECAVDGAYNAGEFALAARILARAYPQLLATGQASTLAYWLQTLPHRVLQPHPTLAALVPALVNQPLTPRELEVARLIGQGASNRDVAQILVVSLGTVKKHLNNIFLKLEVQSRTQAVARARELGLL